MKASISMRRIKKMNSTIWFCVKSLSIATVLMTTSMSFAGNGGGYAGPTFKTVSIPGTDDKGITVGRVHEAFHTCFVTGKNGSTSFLRQILNALGSKQVIENGSDVDKTKLLSLTDAIRSDKVFSQPFGFAKHDEKKMRVSYIPRLATRYNDAYIFKTELKEAVHSELRSLQDSAALILDIDIDPNGGRYFSDEELNQYLAEENNLLIRLNTPQGIWKNEETSYVMSFGALPFISYQKAIKNTSYDQIGRIKDVAQILQGVSLIYPSPTRNGKYPIFSYAGLVSQNEKFLVTAISNDRFVSCLQAELQNSLVDIPQGN